MYSMIQQRYRQARQKLELLEWNGSRIVWPYFFWYHPDIEMVPKAFFPKQLTVGVLNATLDLAALELVGVVGFLGSEVVLSPIVSGCLPWCGLLLGL